MYQHRTLTKLSIRHLSLLLQIATCFEGVDVEEKLSYIPVKAAEQTVIVLAHRTLKSKSPKFDSHLRQFFILSATFSVIKSLIDNAYSPTSA